MKGRREREKRAMAAELTNAYHAAMWSRAKKLPNLQDVIRKVVGGKKRTQSPAEGLRVAAALNALFGGKDLRHLTPRS